MDENIGLKEWATLNVLPDDGTPISVTIIRSKIERASGRRTDPSSEYIRLRRMTERGFVAASKEPQQSRDGRVRETCLYAITPLGKQVRDSVDRDIAAGQRLRREQSAPEVVVRGIGAVGAY